MPSLAAWTLALTWIAASPSSAAATDLDPPRADQAIYGGEEVEPGAWPAVVAVETSKLCTGTLVAPNLVLTAAHCFDPEPTTAVRIRFGDEVGGGQVVLSESWARHPEFCLPSDCGEDLADFAWVRLASPVSVEPIVPITDQAEFDALMRVGAPLRFVGFGKDELGVIGVKREVEASLTGFNASGREFRAGGDGKDTCQGDSGGPALAQLETGEWRLAGVISRGGDCGEGGIYGVPAPELCWVRDSSGVDLLPPGCEACDCIVLAGDAPEDGCGCRSSAAAGRGRTPGSGEGKALWLVAELGLLLGCGLLLRRARRRRALAGGR